jgi:hypothetical protein
MNSSSARKIVEKSQEIIWFVARGAVLKGPYTSSQIDVLLESKEIAHNDFCWRQGFREWRPLSSVEEFDRRANLSLLPAYPSVEVPSASIARSSPPQNFVSRAERAGSTTKRIEVQFARSRRFSISIYEYGVAAIVSVLFAYFASQFAIREVARQVSTRLEMMTLGSFESWGEQDQGLAFEFWAPVLTAPSMEAGFVKLAGVQTAWQDLGRQDLLTAAAPIRSAYQPQEFSDSLKSLDPVFRRPVRVQGEWVLGPNGGLHPQLPGDPLLP